LITLSPKRAFDVPVDAESIKPDVFAGKSIDEIKSLPFWEGNRRRVLDDFFKVDHEREGPGEDVSIRIVGDLTKLKKIGARMSLGRILVEGSVGVRLGEEMKGGNIIVYGNVGGWAGSMMKGGTIEIHGAASDYLGAPYRGSSEGMHGGKIIVFGDVGNEAGAHMRKGLIKIYGHAGQFVGFRMRDGTIYVQKDAEARAGACMTSGKIVVGGFLQSVLPTFSIDGVKEKVKIEEGETVAGPFYLFLGDLTEHGDGKLYVHKEKNPHLSHYEKLL